MSQTGNNILNYIKEIIKQYPITEIDIDKIKDIISKYDCEPYIEMAELFFHLDQNRIDDIRKLTHTYSYKDLQFKIIPGKFDVATSKISNIAVKDITEVYNLITTKKFQDFIKLSEEFYNMTLLQDKLESYFIGKVRDDIEKTFVYDPKDKDKLKGMTFGNMEVVKLNPKTVDILTRTRSKHPCQVRIPYKQLINSKDFITNYGNSRYYKIKHLI